HIGFAEEHAASLLEARSNRAVYLRHVISQRRTPACGAHARRRMGIFQRKGHAMQRPPHRTTSEGFIRSTRPLMCPLGIQGNDAFRAGLCLSICAKCACSTSVAETWPARMAAANCVVLEKTISLMIAP